MERWFSSPTGRRLSWSRLIRLSGQYKPLIGYGAALLGTALAALLRWAIGVVVGPEVPPFITFYPLIMFAALLGGVGPGVLATLLCACHRPVYYRP